MQATFEKLENEMKEVNANAEALKRNFLELTELKHILRKTQGFFEEVIRQTQMTSTTQKLFIIYCTTIFLGSIFLPIAYVVRREVMFSQVSAC